MSSAIDFDWNRQISTCLRICGLILVPSYDVVPEEIDLCRHLSPQLF